ncbi:hypothetical protein QA639_12870 [Bradyrhizobium pachyrhizi]|uniref:hypothetical protein n=1 Tax=Bradyrhizobium pachyrhizi TaxID=280333 RepID=UPI0024B08979|nr:hypothetical protein [Bradyrhizobium pachyrhizi]WFU58330.1 hypothetical protein QA639_12870 [Bradyrhizobium pachyrhizi]
MAAAVVYSGLMRRGLVFGSLTPGKGGCFLTPAGELHCRDRHSAMTRTGTSPVLDLSPATLDGLRAKAGLVEVVMDDWADFPGGVQLDELQSTLILSLAKDVIRFQRTAMIEKPFTVDGFSGWMRDEMDEANLPLDRRIFDGYST